MSLKERLLVRASGGTIDKHLVTAVYWAGCCRLLSKVFLHRYDHC